MEGALSSKWKIRRSTLIYEGDEMNTLIVEGDKGIILIDDGDRGEHYH